MWDIMNIEVLLKGRVAKQTFHLFAISQSHIRHTGSIGGQFLRYSSAALILPHTFEFFWDTLIWVGGKLLLEVLFNSN